MLLAIDIGNTNITCGLYQAEKLVCTFRMTSKQSLTSDEYGLTICGLIEHHGFDIKEVEAAIIASVVPDIMHSMTNAIKKYLRCKPLIVGPGIKTGIRIIAENPKEIGPDRIVDAIAAYEKCGGPVIVVDYGTATTYDMVDENATLVAGITAPGIRTSARALWGDAAMLPEVELKKPATIMAQDTITSMQAGLIYGTIGETEYMIQCLKNESGRQDAKVVATGGLGSIIAEETKAIDVYDAMLTMEGLRILYEKNRK